MVQTFVISLERSPERREKIFAHLKERGLENVHWFKAIDGKKDDLSQYSIDRTRFQRFWHNRFVCCSANVYLSDTEYACALSHLSVYQKIVDENLPMAVILEDDITLKAECVEFYKNIDSVVDEIGCDVLYLWYGDRLKSKSEPVDTKYGVQVKKIGMGKYDWFYNRRRNVNGTVAYVITNRAAKYLLDTSFPVRAQADVILGLLAYNKLNSYKCIPKIFDLTDDETTILHSGDMAENVKPWYSRAFKKIKSLYHKDQISE